MPPNQSKKFNIKFNIKFLQIGFFEEMIQNRVLKFDNFLIGETFERLDIDNPNEAQFGLITIWQFSSKTVVELLKIRMAGGISRDDIGETDVCYRQNPS